MAEGAMTPEEQELLAKYSGMAGRTGVGEGPDPQEMALRQRAAQLQVPGAYELPVEQLLPAVQMAESRAMGGEASLPPSPGGGLPDVPPGGALGAAQGHNDQIKKLMGQGG